MCGNFTCQLPYYQIPPTTIFDLDPARALTLINKDFAKSRVEKLYNRFFWDEGKRGSRGVPRVIIYKRERAYIE